MIEASIQDRRAAEAEAATLVNGLSGRMSAQADRYDELKALIVQATQEQRKGEQTAIGMLDTMQQALVQVLDRIDVLEQRQPVSAAMAVAPMAAEPAAPVFGFGSADAFRPSPRSAVMATYEAYESQRSEFHAEPAPFAATREFPADLPEAGDG